MAIGFVSELKFAFQNIRKTRLQLHSLLETLQASTDLLFIQELPIYKVRNLASATSEEGDPLISSASHPQWVCVDKRSVYPESQVAIYVNKRILPTFSLFMDPFEVPSPNVLTLRLTRNTDQSSAMFVCLYNRPTTRNEAVNTLISTLPFLRNVAIVQGDFNLHSPEWDPRCTETDDAAIELLNALTLADHHLVNEDGQPTWHNPKQNRSSVLDLIFAHTSLLGHNKWTYQNCTEDRGQSDHSLLKLDLGVNRTWRGPPYIKGGSEEEDNFVSAIKLAILSGADNTSSSLSNVFDEIYRTVDYAWRRNSRCPKLGSNPSMWWDEDCTAAKTRLQEECSPAARKAFQKAVKAAQRSFFRKKLETMTSVRAPWEGVRWTKARKSPPVSTIKDNGETVTSTDHLWRVLDRQFNTNSTSEINWNFINALPSHPERDFPPIAVYEVRTALQATSNSSAPGNDHITWRLLKRVLSSYDVTKALTKLYNRIMDESFWPAQLKEAESVVIPKPNKNDYSTPKAYRPIALLNTIGKLLTKVLASRLQYDAIKHNLLHPGQFGGVQKHATTDVALILMDTIVKARERGQHTSVLALDIAQFFPSLDHRVMFTVLTKLGFNRKIANFVAAFFSNRTTRYRWGSSISPPIDASIGVPQGDGLSPILSALYLATLLTLAFQWGIDKRVNILTFVDDGAFVISSESLQNNVDFLATIYKTFLIFLSYFGLTAEHSKLELKHFFAFDLSSRTRKFKEEEQPPLTFEWGEKAWTVPPSDLWRYLGFYFDSRLSFTSHVKIYTNKAFSTMRACQMLGNSHSGLGPEERAVVYKACALPILAYGLALWYAPFGDGAKKCLTRMERVQSFATRWVTGAFRTTPRGAPEVLSGIPPLALWFNICLAKYSARIMSLPENHLLRQIFHYDPVPARYRHIHPRRRRRNLPDDNPIVRLKTDQIQEYFEPYHDEAKPGARVLDEYLTRISFLNMDAPKKNSESFKPWLTSYKRWLSDEINSQVVFFTDGAFWRRQRRGAAACVCWSKGQWIGEKREWCAAASSFDAELAACEIALTWLIQRTDINCATIVVDNKAAINALFDTDTHSSQITSLNICIAARDWLSRSPDHTLRISWCPSHVGITGNERADRLANREKDDTIAPGILREHFIQMAKHRAQRWWKARYRSPQYTGQSWLPIRRRKKPIQPTLGPTTRRFVMREMAENNPVMMARLTRTLTNHAPTGEYRKRFFPDQPTHCPHCRTTPVLHSRSHILTACGKYTSCFVSIRKFCADKKNGRQLKLFLKENPTAFTFDDLPPEPP